MSQPSTNTFTTRSLRVKVITTIALAILALIIGLYVPLRKIILDNFSAVEQDTVTTNIQRVQATLDGMLRSLVGTTKDYAHWDDMYDYAQTSDATGIEDSISTIYESLNVDLVVILDGSGNPLYGQVYDSGSATLSDVSPSFFATYASPLQQLPFPTSDVTGTIQTEQGVFLVASAPILTSAKQGPSRGTFILGRLMTPDLLAEIGELTRLPVEFVTFDSGTLSPELDQARYRLISGEEIVVTPIDQQTIVGYSLVRSLRSEPVGLFKIARPRPILSQATQTLNYSMIALFLAAVVLCVLVTVLLQTFILKRVLHQHDLMEEIAANPERTLRLPIDGRDEIAGLGMTINTMLDSIAHAQTAHLAAEVERERLQAELIRTQSATLAKLSAPLIPISQDVLVLPLIGEMDETRAQRVVSTTLHGITTNNARVAIVDLTGLEQVDQSTATMLVQLARATRIIGSQILITGMRGNVARMMMDLSVSLEGIDTYSTLEQGIAAALEEVEKKRLIW